ncbi:golgin-45 [Gallus gallus]|uniref:Basic leucine zipper nuclear factor 1 n=1 Tax=Gallus gallus TaxID=9031 RepID=E1C3Q8_CHICK|nr:golgin-45 [Gallus gallus]XP_015152192.1 golgin-45 [Gallus gallus]XP_040516103.1 golgin-45 [Gallus gallus]XP_040516104.1 golgin-45 [Gallus gallus]XP_040516105.1 golgin-45 [Gallus gallus]XP_416590.1 golgin-45 [Gallus gallus]|eukprot:XP_004938283.1 golgin-45 [Gallus gallus]
MTSLEKVDYASSPIRGPGDGMETEQMGESLEVSAGASATNHQVRHSPQKKAVSSLSPGVLQLGQIHADKSVEVEAVRILVPKAAITHVVATKNAKVAKSAGHKGDAFHQSDGTADPKKEQTELKNAIEKLKNSEKRLLQDKEGLSNQLRIQTEVNRELKKLLVASVGDDLQYHFERMAREKNQLILENEVLGRNLSQLSEQLERMSIQCDVWRSKFLASRVMADELTNTRAILQRQTRDAQTAIQDLLNERDQFRQEMIHTQKLLEELMVSLQWGRQQTYYPSAQPYTTTELASVNCKLAKAVSSHLLGNVGTSSPKKTSTAVEFCNTPAEKMAERVLRVLDPAARTETSTEASFSETSPSSFLSTKKNIGRFHPYTRYEDITFNCCDHCQGELIAL